MIKIEKSIYEGYLWYSDAAEPKVYDQEEFELVIKEDENPFIVEGQLYDTDRMKSISIKFVDGKYIFQTHDVDSLDFNKADVDIKHFMSNRMNGRKLRFLNYWNEMEDALCDNMKVLVPSKRVFAGFVNE